MIILDSEEKLPLRLSNVEQWRLCCLSFYFKQIRQKQSRAGNRVFFKGCYEHAIYSALLEHSNCSTLSQKIQPVENSHTAKSLTTAEIGRWGCFCEHKKAIFTNLGKLQVTSTGGDSVGKSSLPSTLVIKVFIWLLF